MSAPAWPRTDPAPPLGADEIHVWTFALLAADLTRLRATLSDTERQRADRFAQAASRQQYTVTRATLRRLLGAYLGVDADGVPLTADDRGKPALAAPWSGLHFNVSHTSGLAVVALTRRGAVGVDVERLRPQANHRDLAARFFAPAEAAALAQLSSATVEEAFFHVWTRKEAFLKATGLGLAGGLDRFEVSVPPDEPVRLVRLDGDRHAAARWSLHALTPAAGYVAALAIEDGAHRLCCFSPPAG